MTLVDRRVIDISRDKVCYQRLDYHDLVIYRTIAEHKGATGNDLLGASGDFRVGGRLL